MKKFTVNYRPSLGSFLDEKNIRWESLSNDRIMIYCKDIDQLFTIACNYEAWYGSIDTDYTVGRIPM